MPSRGPTRTLILFVRHGHTPTTGVVLPGRAKGLHLSDEGRAQAKALAVNLAGVTATLAAKRASRGKRPGPALRVEAVYSSPLERARETAAPIGSELGLTVQAERGLVECDYGEWTGAELKALARLPEWRTVQQWPSGWRFPSGESMVEMQDRMLLAIERIRLRHPGGAVVAVSHADTIRAAVTHALGMHLDQFQRIMVAPCSVSAVSYGGERPAVLTVNATGADVLGQAP